MAGGESSAMSASAMSITLNVYAQAPFAEAELKKWLTNPKLATKRGDSHWEDLAGAEVIAETPAAYRRKIADANVLYELETSASRSRASLDLQRTLWATIGTLTEGLVEDPQDGEYHDTKSEIATIDSEQRLHKLVNGVFALLIATEIATLVAQFTMGQTRWLSGVAHIIVVATFWWSARDRESFGRWATVALAAIIAYFDIRIVSAVVDENSGRAVVLAIRAAIYTLAAGIMLLPVMGTYFKRGDHE